MLLFYIIYNINPIPSHIKLYLKEQRFLARMLFLYLPKCIVIYRFQYNTRKHIFNFIYLFILFELSKQNYLWLCYHNIQSDDSATVLVTFLRLKKMLWLNVVVGFFSRDLQVRKTCTTATARRRRRRLTCNKLRRDTVNTIKRLRVVRRQRCRSRLTWARCVITGRYSRRRRTRITTTRRFTDTTGKIPSVDLSDSFFI